MKTGQILFEKVEGMQDKRRPCVVIVGANGRGFFVPLSTQDWKTDHTVPVGKCVSSNRKLTYAILNKCFIRRVKGEFADAGASDEAVQAIIWALNRMFDPAWATFMSKGIVG